MERKQSRRNFLKTSSLGAVAPAVDWMGNPPPVNVPDIQPPDPPDPKRVLDLSPAQWIWYPATRVLQNTVVLFRREVSLDRPVRLATGYLLGDSRYRLFVDDHRIQWGPAPSDPRFSEADPLDLTEKLTVGNHTIGAEVLYFGTGDGTWPVGKPGFIFLLNIEFEDDTSSQIVSDTSWQTFLAKSWKPGQFKRWYLRALQEEFDARLYPYGWTRQDFQAGPDWLPALDLKGASDKPALTAPGLRDYQFDSQGDPETTQLRARQVPLLNESTVLAAGLREQFRVRWLRPAEEYFESGTISSFEATATDEAESTAPNEWTATIKSEDGLALTFEFQEQIVGWPLFEIEAPEGTVVELMIHEGHQTGGSPLLNTGYHAWTRFICREGNNAFETFDFESLRWIQLHIRGAEGRVRIRNVAVRRRKFPWANPASIDCSDPDLTRIWNACLNTLDNNSHDTIVDCMGRERQQYSGDIGHVIHSIMLGHGEYRLPGRYVDTFSQGITSAGYYLDSWPAYDRLNRIPQRELGLTRWGPLLDHGIGHVFDAWYYLLYSGDTEALVEVFPRIVRFFAYLQGLRQENGLLPVEQLGIPVVWIDHDAFANQRDKQCCFNLYAISMLRHALEPLCDAFERDDVAREATQLADELLASTVRTFWSDERQLFVSNLPWISEDASLRTDDRSLALSIMFDLCPEGEQAAAMRMLVDAPDEMGYSYPANATWRMWGLAKAGRADVVIEELKSTWSAMRSVLENNTVSEGWRPTYDSTAQWSHSAVSPLHFLYMNIIGLEPKLPGFGWYEIRPQPGAIEQLTAAAHTPFGQIDFETSGLLGSRTISIRVPSGGKGVLVLDDREVVDLVEQPGYRVPDLKHYILPVDETTTVQLRYT